MMGGKQWFYNFCVRFLIERVTKLRGRDSHRQGLSRPGYPEVCSVSAAAITMGKPRHTGST